MNDLDTLNIETNNVSAINTDTLPIPVLNQDEMTAAIEAGFHSVSPAIAGLTIEPVLDHSALLLDAEMNLTPVTEIALRIKMAHKAAGIRTEDEA